MTAFNAVRFRVKPGRDKDFLAAHEKIDRNWRGLKHVNVIKTGDHTYCIIGEWTDMAAMADARPHMVATLDSFRSLLDAFAIHSPGPRPDAEAGVEAMRVIERIRELAP